MGEPVEFFLEIGNKKFLTIFDLGSGASMINPKEAKDIRKIETKLLKNPVEIEVGNGEILFLERATLLEIKSENTKDYAWFIENPLLPVPSLLGRKTATRIGMNFIKERLYWKEKEIPTRRVPSHTLLMLSNHLKPFQKEDADRGMDLTVEKEREGANPHAEKTTGSHETKVGWEETIQKPDESMDQAEQAETVQETAPQTAFLPTRTQIPRGKTKIFLQTKECLGPDGFFMPNFDPFGKILIPPSLIRFEERIRDGKKVLEACIIATNNGQTTVTLRKNANVGKVQFISDKDVERTNLIEIFDENIIEKIENLKEKRGKEKETNIEKTINTKVRLNYFKALSGPLFEEEEMECNTMEFRSFLGKIRTESQEEDCDEEFSEQLTHILTLMGLINMKEKGNETLTEEEKAVFEKFRLEEANVTPKQKKILAKLLLKHKRVFSADDTEKEINHTPGVECPINTTSGPFKCRAPRTTPVEDEIIWKHIMKMARRKVIRPSTSAWASPIILADKKNGKIRFCVDFQKLNSVMVQDAYPLPRMDEILATLGKAKMFSTIDLTDAFWSIKVREEDIHKTAFTSKYGLWEFISMPFGLTNAPATQQRFIESVLDGLLWKTCFAYIDDILCFSNSFDDHVEHLDKILEKLGDAGLQLQPPKCFFCRNTFEILGFVASADGIKPDPRKVEAIKNYPEPKSPKEIDSFLGMVSWLRKFIPQCTRNTRNLRICAKMKKNFKMSVDALREFKKLKTILSSDTCMAHPQLDKQFFIHVDASKYALGAILTQLDENGRHRVIEYASKVLSPTQQSYSNTAREALGIIWSLQHFRFYVHGRNPIVFCDCKSLSHLAGEKSTAMPTQISLRDWLSRILHFNPKVVHKPGKLMAIPDALSRHFVAYSESPKGETETIKISSENEKGTEEQVFEALLSTALNHRLVPTLSLQKQTEILKRNLLESNFEEFGCIRSLAGRYNTRSKKKSKNASQRADTRDPENEFVQAQDPGIMENVTGTPVIPQPESPKSTACEEILAEAEEMVENSKVEMSEEENLEDLALKQRVDPNLLNLVEYLQFGRLPMNRSEARHIRNTALSHMLDERGILRRTDVGTLEGRGFPAVLPREMWDEVIEMSHRPPLSGHKKYDKLLPELKKRFYFPNMAIYLKSYCRRCPECQISTIGKKLTLPVQPFHSNYPGVLVHLDCTPGSKETERGNSHILAIIDSFTGYVKLYPLPQPDGKGVAEALLSYISVNSMPLKIVTDNGSEFLNSVMTELIKLLGMKTNRIAPYNSRCNGKVENVHKTVQTIIRAYINEHAKDWDLLIPYVEFAINTSRSEVTKYTPFYLHFGRHPILPLDAFTRASIPQPEKSVEQFVEKIRENRDKVFEWVWQQKEKELILSFCKRKASIL